MALALLTATMPTSEANGLPEKKFNAPVFLCILGTITAIMGGALVAVHAYTADIAGLSKSIDELSEAIERAKESENENPDQEELATEEKEALIEQRATLIQERYEEQWNLAGCGAMTVLGLLAAAWGGGMMSASDEKNRDALAMNQAAIIRNQTILEQHQVALAQHQEQHTTNITNAAGTAIKARFDRLEDFIRILRSQ